MKKETITLLVAFLLGFGFYHYYGKSIVQGAGSGSGYGSSDDSLTEEDLKPEVDEIIGKTPTGQNVTVNGGTSFGSQDNISSVSSIEAVRILR
jgi:hypothetical protein